MSIKEGNLLDQEIIEYLESTLPQFSNWIQELQTILNHELPLAEDFLKIPENDEKYKNMKWSTVEKLRSRAIKLVDQMKYVKNLANNINTPTLTSDLENCK